MMYPFILIQLFERVNPSLQKQTLVYTALIAWFEDVDFFDIPQAIVNMTVMILYVSMLR